MTPQDYASACEATAARPLGALGQALGAGMAVECPKRGIATPERLAAFLAQTSHETGGYQWLVELGGPTYFAKYDGRRDLGNTQPGDGYRFRGRSPIQLTGRANYATYGQALGLDLVGDPDLAAEPGVGVAIAALFWSGHGLNELADKGDFIGITKRINGGLNGLPDREAAWARAKAHLGVK